MKEKRPKHMEYVEQYVKPMTSS